MKGPEIHKVVNYTKKEQMSFDITVGHEAFSNLKFQKAKVRLNGRDPEKVQIVRASLATSMEKYAPRPPERKEIGKENLSWEWIFEGKVRDSHRLSRYIEGNVRRYFCKNCGVFLPEGNLFCDSCRATLPKEALSLPAPKSTTGMKSPSGFASIFGRKKPSPPPKSKAGAKSGSGFGKLFGRKKPVLDSSS